MRRLPINSSTRRISTSKKLMLGQKVQLKLDGVYQWKYVKDWIIEHPDILYQHLYNHKLNKLTAVQITKDAVILLKKELKKRHPELILEIEKKT